MSSSPIPTPTSILSFTGTRFLCVDFHLGGWPPCALPTPISLHFLGGFTPSSTRFDHIVSPRFSHRLNLSASSSSVAGLHLPLSILRTASGETLKWFASTGVVNRSGAVWFKCRIPSMASGESFLRGFQASPPSFSLSAAFCNCHDGLSLIWAGPWSASREAPAFLLYSALSVCHDGLSLVCAGAGRSSREAPVLLLYPGILNSSDAANSACLSSSFPGDVRGSRSSALERRCRAVVENRRAAGRDTAVRVRGRNSAVDTERMNRLNVLWEHEKQFISEACVNEGFRRTKTFRKDVARTHPPRYRQEMRLSGHTVRRTLLPHIKLQPQLQSSQNLLIHLELCH
jgi:hypothetical protein